MTTSNTGTASTPGCSAPNNSACVQGTADYATPADPNVTAYPIVFTNVATAAPPTVNVRAVSCNGTTASAEVSATYTLAAGPVVAKAYQAGTTPTTSGELTQGAQGSNAGPRITTGTQSTFPIRSQGIDVYIEGDNTYAPGPAGVAASTSATYNAQDSSTGGPRPRRPTANGSICYTLDGTLPAVISRGQGGTASPMTDAEDNSAAPLNGTQSSNGTTGANQNPGCIADIATNPATVCIRATGTQTVNGVAIGNTTLASKTQDPRLGNIDSTVNIRAVQCKNVDYQNSPTTESASYTFVPYAHTITFNGSQDPANPPVNQQQAGFYTNGTATDTSDNTSATAYGGEDFPADTGTLYGTWDATYVYLALGGVSLNTTNSDYIQIYARGGEITVPNQLQTGTLNSEPTMIPNNAPNGTVSSPIGYPSGQTYTGQGAATPAANTTATNTGNTGDTNALNTSTGNAGQSAAAPALPFRVNYHLFVSLNALTTNGSNSVPLTTHMWDGAKWIAAPGGSAGDVLATTGNPATNITYLEIRIKRSLIGSPAFFYGFGDVANSNATTANMMTGAASNNNGTSNGFPAGAARNPGAAAGAFGMGTPAGADAVGYLRFNLNGFRYPDYRTSGGGPGAGDQSATPTTATSFSFYNNWHRSGDVYATDPRTNAEVNP